MCPSVLATAVVSPINAHALFPDTNFFLQCQTPSDIPWRDVTADDEIRLMVCRTVQGEIDRFKGDGKGRRSDRARRVSSYFARAINDGRLLFLRESSPQMTIELSPPHSPIPCLSGRLGHDAERRPEALSTLQWLYEHRPVEFRRALPAERVVAIAANEDLRHAHAPKIHALIISLHR